MSPIQDQELNDLEEISGTAPPNSRIAVAIDAFTPLAANADKNGLWLISCPFELKPGTHTIEARGENYGQVNRKSINFVILAPREVLSIPEIFYPVRYSSIGGSSITVVGRGTPGNTVSIRLPGAPRAEAEVLANGSWSYVFPGKFKPGYYVLTARQINPQGDKSPDAWEEFWVVSFSS